MVKTHLILYLCFVPSDFSSASKDLWGQKARAKLLFCFIFSISRPCLLSFRFFAPCAERAFPCLTASPFRARLGHIPRRSAPLTQHHALSKPMPWLRCPGIAAWNWLGEIPTLAWVWCAKTPGSDLCSLLFPFLWFHSISLVLPRSGELSALLRPTELHPLFGSHLLTSFFFFFPRESIRQRRYVVMWMVHTNKLHCIFSLLRLILILCFKSTLVAVADKRNTK